MWAPLLVQVSAVFYAIVGVLGILRFIQYTRVVRGWTLVMALFGALSVQAAGLILRGIWLGQIPLANLHDGLVFFSFLVALIGGVIACKTRVALTATIVASVAAVMLTLAATLAPVSHTLPRSPLFPVHLATAFLGEALFATAGAVSTIYLVQFQRLKSKRRSSITARRLPPLEVLDRTSTRLILVGFPLMTIGLFTGALYSKAALGTYWKWGILNTVAVVVWVVFLAVLYFRYSIGWHGKKAAGLTVAGVACTLGALLAEYLF